MPLPLTVSCFSKIQIGFTFLVPAHLGSPGKRAIKRVCVCVYCFADFGIKTGERDNELGTLTARFMYRDDNMITVILFFFSKFIQPKNSTSI